MKSSLKCLVTGGAGFIGSHLCDRLVHIGYEVYCVDNFITGNKKNISHLLSHPGFHLIIHDIIKPLSSNVQPLVQDISYLYHLASPASPAQYRKYSIETLLVNSVGTYRMLELTKKVNCYFLLASTSEVYGNPKEHPQKESYYGNVNPVGERACYDEGKRFSEALTMEYVRKYQLKARIARIFNTYGPRMRRDDGRVVSNFITQALSHKPLTLYGDGSQTRSLCYISDMVEGLLKVMETKGIEGEVINLGNPDEREVREIGMLVCKLTGSSSELISTKKRYIDDPEKRKPDISKAKKLLSWMPKVTLFEGLSHTIDYFKTI